MGGIRGDQTAGIRKLQLAARNGRYLSPFAGILLAVAHLRNQHEFPHNHLFVEEIAKLQALMDRDAKTRAAAASSPGNVQ